MPMTRTPLAVKTARKAEFRDLIARSGLDDVSVACLVGISLRRVVNCRSNGPRHCPTEATLAVLRAFVASLEDAPNPSPSRESLIPQVVNPA